jgi:hypothetical protein
MGTAGEAFSDEVRSVIVTGKLNLPVTTWGSGRTSLDGNRGCLLSVGAALGSLTTSSTLALPTLALGLPVSVSHVFLRVLSDNSVGSGVVLDRCLSKALTSTLGVSRPLLLGPFAQLPSLGKLGLTKELLGDLLAVVDNLSRDAFDDGTGRLAGPTLEVLLGELFSHFRHGGGVLIPLAHNNVSILHHTGLP